jgi:hypothetical protein
VRKGGQTFFFTFSHKVAIFFIFSNVFLENMKNSWRIDQNIQIIGNEGVQYDFLVPFFFLTLAINYLKKIWKKMFKQFQRIRGSRTIKWSGDLMQFENHRSIRLWLFLEKGQNRQNPWKLQFSNWYQRHIKRLFSENFGLNHRNCYFSNNKEDVFFPSETYQKKVKLLMCVIPKMR